MVQSSMYFMYCEYCTRTLSVLPACRQIRSSSAVRCCFAGPTTGCTDATARLIGD